MGLRLTLQTAHQAFEDAGIPHALIGGMGLATLGIHRATQDVDFLINGEQREQAKDALAKNGFVLIFESPEVLHFEGVGRVDLLLANRALSKAMLQSAKPFPQHGIRCVSAEGIIGLKIQAYINDRRRELQDKADIRSLIEKHPSLDWAQVKQYADLFGEWESIRKLGGRE